MKETGNLEFIMALMLMSVVVIGITLNIVGVIQ